MTPQSLHSYFSVNSYIKHNIFFLVNKQSLVTFFWKIMTWTGKLWLHFVGNKAKGWISKRVFQENKACQIFRIKQTFFTPWYAHLRTALVSSFRETFWNFCSWNLILANLKRSKIFIFEIAELNTRKILYL